MPRTNISSARRRKLGTSIRAAQTELRKAQRKRWVIRFSWKHGYAKGDPRDWRSWRSKGVVPILFHSHEEAQLYWDAHGFKNMNQKKLSSCIETIWLPEET